MENKHMIAKWIASYVISGDILSNKEIKDIIMILGLKGDSFIFFVYFHGTTVGHGSSTELISKKQKWGQRNPFDEYYYACPFTLGWTVVFKRSQTNLF